MNPTLNKALQAIAVYVLGLICPGVPSWLWAAIVAALFSGDITPEHIMAFAVEHNITATPDYDIEKNGQKETNVVRAQGQVNGNFNKDT